ncbi:MAG: DUF402 domain-containing protein [Pyrinomonadaceae bacterium]
MKSSLEQQAASVQAVNTAPEQTIIRACKFDGAVHRQWHARLTRRTGELLVFDAEFAETIHHKLLGTIERGTQSTEYYWLDRPYNIFRFSAPGGELRNFYCNINQPPSFADQVLTYVDLDIDVLVAPDFSYTVLDEDEFAANAARYKYPASLQQAARRALRELIELIEARGFPFNEN